MKPDRKFHVLIESFLNSEDSWKTKEIDWLTSLVSVMDNQLYFKQDYLSLKGHEKIKVASFTFKSSSNRPQKNLSCLFRRQILLDT